MVKKWWEKLIREDCRKCIYRQACGDIFTETHKCPSNSGGESWASFKKGSPITYVG
jgi:hypothetical protein